MNCDGRVNIVYSSEATTIKMQTWKLLGMREIGIKWKSRETIMRQKISEYSCILRECL